uniref:DUF148 domain-containing protein n=1 Tax=Rhabditophanes sp. KR3021 TaxID=114890 RepID=A0AC35TIM6_9BILA
MIFKFAILAIFCGISLIGGRSIQNMPCDGISSDFIPSEISDFINTMTDEDKAYLIDMFFNFMKGPQAASGVGRFDNFVHKMTVLDQEYKQKAASLSVESKAWFDSTLESLDQLKKIDNPMYIGLVLQGVIKNAVITFNSLSEDAKMELEATYPRITKTVKTNLAKLVIANVLKN